MRILMRRLSFLLALVLVLSLAGCGGREETDRELTDAFTALLAQDFEVQYLFYGGGLPVAAEDPVQVGDSTYYPSASPQYKTIRDLEDLLRSTYAREEEIGTILGRVTPGEDLLFMEEGGKLYKNGGEWVVHFPYTTDEETVRIAQRDGGRVTFQFEDEAADGSLYKTTLAMVKGDKGWRLETQLIGAERQLIREGAAEDSFFSQGQAGAMAQSFLDALVAADASAVEALSCAPAGTYAGWGALRVTSAKVEEVLEDLDVQGEYIAALTVEDGAGILEEGQVRYRLKIGMTNALRYVTESGDLTRTLSVDYFQPEALRPYELQAGPGRDNAAADAVDRLIGFFGPLSFASPGELGDSRITEYVLMELENSGDPKPSHTGEEVREEALRLFGLRDFAPSQDYYRAELDGYSAGGRGFVMANKLSFPGEPEGGRVAVEVRCFGDPLQTTAERTLIYTLEEDGAGGWRFVSALPA